MRSNNEIEAEVAALRKALENQTRWNEKARATINQSIRVLEMRLTADEIENTYYADESDPEYRDSDNDLYNALMTVHYWMIEEKGYAPPSYEL
jgi:hypothetical protein